jgi:hypothetical protein
MPGRECSRLKQDDLGGAASPRMSREVPTACACAGSRRVQARPGTGVNAILQGSFDVNLITRNEGVRGSNPRVGLALFAGISSS